MLWARNSIDSDANVTSIAVDNSGNVYMTGYFDYTYLIFGPYTLTNTLYYTRSFLVKYDSSGNVLWAKTPSCADTSYIRGMSVTTDAADNIYITGFFRSGLLVFGNDTLSNATDAVNDVFFAKYNAAGNALWARQSTNGHIPVNYFVAVSADNSGNVFIAGKANETAYSNILIFNNDTIHDPVLYFVKYDSSGNLHAAKTIGGNANNLGALSFVCDPTGHLNICGTFGDSIFIGADTLIDSTPVAPPGFNNAFITKFDTAGNVLWARKAGGLTIFNSIAADVHGNLYVTGQTEGVLSATPPYPIIQPFLGLTINFFGGYDIVLAKYDNAGNVSFASCVGGSSDDIGNAITVDDAGNVYITGSLGSSTMMIGGDVLHGGNDMFVARFNPLLPMGVPTLTTQATSLTVYPIPATATINFRFNDPIPGPATIRLSDITGRLTEQQCLQNSTTASFNVANYSPGIYFYQVITNGNTQSGKVLIGK